MRSVRRSTVVRAASATAMALLIAASGSAQINRRQDTRVTPGDGRALDRNLQVNSGGINSSRASVADLTRFNNAIITGNASDGRSFRGSVGYSSTTDFGGRLGSNDLYTFRRDTVQGSFGGTGIRGTDALRYQFMGATGQSLPGYFARSGGLVDRAGSAASGATAGMALRSTADYLTAQSLRPALVGSRQSNDGAIWNAAASPLLGVRWMQIDTSANPSELADRDRSRLAQGVRVVDELDDNPLPGEQQIRRSSIEEAISRRSGRTGVLSGMEVAAPGVVNPMERARRDALAAEVERVEPEDLSAPSRVPTNTRQAFEQGFRGSTTPGRDAQATPAEGAGDQATGQMGDAWRVQLDRLRGELRGDPRRPAPGRPGTPGTPTPGEPAERQPGDPAAPLPPLERPKGEPEQSGRTPEPGSPEDLERYRRLRELDTSQGLTPELIRALAAGRNVRHERLVGPVPEGDVPVSKMYLDLMDSGQEALGRGAFFDAEERFTRALAARPRDPMASVGRIHAQLGASLFSSAAINFRTLMTNYPEMVGNRYDGKLTPTGERGDEIAARLRAEVAAAEGSFGRDTGLLLAYLGHLREDPAMVQEGLEAMRLRLDQSKEDQVRLYEVLKAAWIGE
jgi:hypothetical protein